MATGEVHAFLGNMRGYNPFITGGILCFFSQLFQFFYDNGSVWHPQWQTLAHIIIHGENAKLLSQLAVIPFFSFLQHQQVFVQLFLIGE